MTKYSIIISTFPDKESAKRAAKLLVEKRLAACVQLLPIESLYSWQGKICNESEIMLLIKSKTDLLGEITAAIREIHTYDVPEIVQVPIEGGLSEYLEWIWDCTK
ncbi:MAG: divalent-cation tolerance protein CutA [Oscillospiraceae bacterium]|jgi:periplasmic divalent cation tolerance protein|nr:divalent-cation tolerance protein CutA [Oscillospiraceae bacterium]